METLYKRIESECEDCKRFMRACLTCDGTKKVIKYIPAETLSKEDIIKVLDVNSKEGWSGDAEAVGYVDFEKVAEQILNLTK